MSDKDSESGAPAAKVYRIRMLHQEIGRVRRVWRSVWTTIVLLTPLAIFVEEKWEIPDRHWIDVLDKASGDVVITYSHRLRSDALQHWASLRERLRDMTASEFAEDLGLGTPGMDPGAPGTT